MCRLPRWCCYEEWDDTDSVVWTQSGTASVSGDRVTIRVTHENGAPIKVFTIVANWEVEGDELRLTVVDGPVTYVLAGTRR